jgi:hypothetical protein
VRPSQSLRNVLHSKNKACSNQMLYLSNPSSLIRTRHLSQTNFQEVATRVTTSETGILSDRRFRDVLLYHRLDSIIL